MYLIAAITISDTAVTIHKVGALVRDEPATYTMSFHDLPTGEKEDLVFQNECDAVYALAAWIAADEDNLGTVLNKAHDDLYARIKTKNKFLP